MGTSSCKLRLREFPRDIDGQKTECWKSEQRVQGGLKIKSRSVDVCREERSIFNPRLALRRFREQIPDSISWPQAAHVRGLEAVAMSRFPAVGPRKVLENGFPL